MTINLEDFVDKEVIITLKSGKVIETTICKQKNLQYPYWGTYQDAEGHTIKHHFTKDGVYDEDYADSYGIKYIQLKNQPKELKMTKLSNRTFQQLADTLTSEVIDYINQDERYVLFMQEVIPDALSHMMGQLDEGLHFELSMAIMDRITMKPSSIMGNLK